MYKFLTKLVNLFFLTLLFGSCSSTRFFKSSDYIIDRNEIYEDGIILKNNPINFVIKTKSNKKILGIPLKRILYESSHPDPDSEFKKWLNKNEKRKKRLENWITRQTNKSTKHLCN